MIVTIILFDLLTAVRFLLKPEVKQIVTESSPENLRRLLIGNIFLPQQAKLLTVLQNRQIIRLGSNTPIAVDIRLITVTNVPFAELANEQHFQSRKGIGTHKGRTLSTAGKIQDLMRKK
jgi:homoserine trans-succinylase